MRRLEAGARERKRSQRGQIRENWTTKVRQMLKRLDQKLRATTVAITRVLGNACSTQVRVGLRECATDRSCRRAV